MSHSSSPLELITDVSGSVTFGWVGDGVYYARFSRCLSARLGEAFAARLRAAASAAPTIRYFADARALESYDLLARSAFVRVVTELRRKFEALTLLHWDGAEANPALVAALGRPLEIVKDAIEFETRLMAAAPQARYKLSGEVDVPQRSRWPLRR
jgi:hypothetical protein